MPLLLLLSCLPSGFNMTALWLLLRTLDQRPPLVKWQVLVFRGSLGKSPWWAYFQESVNVHRGPNLPRANSPIPCKESLFLVKVQSPVSHFLPWYSWWSAAPRWRWLTYESWGVRAEAAGEAAGPQQAAPQAQLCSPAGSAASTWGLEAGEPRWKHRPPTVCPYNKRQKWVREPTHIERVPFLYFLKLKNVLFKKHGVLW